MPSYLSRPLIRAAPMSSLEHAPARGFGDKYLGTGSISGVVREDGAPSVRRLNLHVRPKGTLIASVWSNTQGFYTFKKVAKQYKYYIVCVDEGGQETQYPALIQDLISGDYDDNQLV